MTARERNRLAWHLDGLATLTAEPALGAVRPHDTVLKVDVVLDSLSVDLPKIIARINQPPEQEVDVCLQSPNGKRFLVRLEDAPAAVADLDPADQPQWAEAVATAADG